ncbi:TPA: hypothetical protein ACIVGQ_004475, partial [Salmonella enterica subsp. enterica serovar Wangata]
PEYDATGRRTCTRYPDEHLIRWYYDDGDRLFSQQVLRLRDGAEKPVSSTEYRYDSEYRLVSATTPDARVEFGMRTGGRPPGRAYTGCTSRVR